MDDIVVRSRYPHSGTYARRKRKHSRSVGRNGSRGISVENIVKQVAISLLILIAVGIVKNIDTPATNYLTNRLKEALSYNIEIGSIFESIDKGINMLFNKSTTGNEELSFREDAVNVSRNGRATDFTGKVIEYASLPGEDYIDRSTNENNAAGPDASLRNVTDRSDTNGRSLLKTGMFIVPVEGPLGSPYGERVDPIKKVLKLHKGIDVEANKGASIKAAMSGEVVEAGSEPTYGNYIKLKHEDGYMTVYAHCSQLIAKKGQKIGRGDIIAKVGNTGASVGSHLHFEIWKDDKPVDPLNYIDVPSK